MIPADKIQENQYTTGNEFTYKDDKNYYQGYYCIISNTKYYTGKTYDDNSKELLKADVPQAVPPPTSLPPQTTPTRYFIRKVTEFPIKIQEVSEQTYGNYVNDPFYQTAAITTPQDEANADTQIPGLTSFL
jgi:hypothetical protein